METLFATNIIEIRISTMCLQGPCLHGLAIIVKGESEPRIFQNVCGDKILRLICASGARKVSRDMHRHFKWFIEQPEWKVSTERSHQEREPIELSKTVRVIYDLGKRLTPLKVPAAPKPTVPKPTREFDWSNQEKVRKMIEKSYCSWK
jgi:hypothetical protein